MYMANFLLDSRTPGRSTSMTMATMQRVNHGGDTAGGCSYLYMVDNFSFGLLLEDKQLFVISFIVRTLRMAELGRRIQRTKRSPRCDCGMLGSGKGIEETLASSTQSDILLCTSSRYPDSKFAQEPQVYFWNLRGRTCWGWLVGVCSSGKEWLTLLVMKSLWVSKCRLGIGTWTVT